MNFLPENDQNIGAREEQQDAFGFSTEEQRFQQHGGFMAVVADGMGGLMKGREASQIACETMRKAYEAKRPDESIPKALHRALLTANDEVYDMAHRAGIVAETGTTLVAAVVQENTLHWISVGDSRIYLFRDGVLTLLTVDHVYARHLAQEVAEGNLSPEDAENHPEQHHLTSFLGLDTLEEVDRSLKPFPLRTGDRILLCSDGLYGTVSDKEIVDILSKEPPGKAASTLIQATLAKKRPHQDNVTVAIINAPAVSASAGGSKTPTRRSVPLSPRQKLWLGMLGVLLLGSAALFVLPRAISLVQGVFLGQPTDSLSTEQLTDSSSTKQPTDSLSTEEPLLKPDQEEPEDTDEKLPPDSVGTSEGDDAR